MPLFRCSADELAKVLAENDETYNQGVAFFNTLIGRGVLDSKLESELRRDLILFENASKIAMNSKWYAFHVTDSWSMDQGGSGVGIELYKMVSNDLVTQLGLGSSGPSSEEGAINEKLHL